MKTLQDNSVRLLTQFDVHATLIDLLKFAPESNFTDFSELDVMEGNENNGTSILRPFPEKFQKRTCQTIPANAAYCLCEYKKKSVDDPTLIERLLKVALEELNGYLRENGVSGSCETLTLGKLKSVNGFIPIEKTNLYEIEFIVKESKGEFRVLLKKDSNGVFNREGDFLRLNKYEGQSDCIDSKRADLRSICLCKGIKV